MPHLWAHQRSGASGKTARVYALVDAHWDKIEDDFYTYWGVDALDFFRGLKPWDQFLRLVDRAVLREGSALWAAKLSDEEFLESLWEKYRKNRRAFDNVEEVRPELFGFDRIQAMMTNIANLIIASRIDRNPHVQKHLKMLPTPIFPMEAIELRWRALSRRKRASGIEAAQAQWDRMVAETGVRPNG